MMVWCLAITLHYIIRRGGSSVRIFYQKIIKSIIPSSFLARFDFPRSVWKAESEQVAANSSTMGSTIKPTHRHPSAKLLSPSGEQFYLHSHSFPEFWNGCEKAIGRDSRKLSGFEFMHAATVDATFLQERRYIDLAQGLPDFGK